MTEIKNVRSSASEVLPVEIGEHFVFVRTNIHAIEENIGSDNEFIGFEYDEKQYTKDEYIKLLSEKNSILEQQFTDTQLALVELYESVVV